MFRRSDESGADAAKRLAKSFLETSGFVCGSLKDTLTDQDNIQWIENEVGNIKTKMEGPRKQIFNHADKLCQGDQPLSPHSPESLGSSYFDEMDDTLESNSRTRTSSTGDQDEATATSTLLTSETPDRKSKPVDRKIKTPTRAISENRAKIAPNNRATGDSGSVSHSLVIGLCLSRRHATLGHPDTVTRQTAFDFNELQDRNYKYVSSTDHSGWLAGGGERGDPNGVKENVGATLEFERSESIATSKSEDSEGPNSKNFGGRNKTAAPDKVHIPIIQIDADSAATVDAIISALARGEVFIPHISILPEALSVNGISPPDLVVRFGCEKNDDVNPEEWPNWCLEFIHNQLYDCFSSMGAQWTKRPFQITLARKVRWKTVKHMNKYFAHSEEVINSWREKGPQFLQPPFPDDSSSGATNEEISRPHGIYLLRNGVPTNYFAPNFEPPYTTKMNRSLIRNVVNKSWDVKRRDWRIEPVPRMRTPALIISTVMGCTGPGQVTLSPVEGNMVGSIIPMTTDFEPVKDRRDVGQKSSIQEKKESHGRKKTTSAHESQHTDDHHGKDQHEKEPDCTPGLMPSDDSYCNTRPDGTVSLEETISEPVSENCTQSNAESPETNNYDFDRKRSSTSSKGVSFSIDEKSAASFNEETYNKDPPQTNNESQSSFAERRLERERERDIERQKVEALERSLNDTHLRPMDSSKAEKYARTKVS